jgi:3-oxoacyl-(acyl-carrier-protein) synthase
LCFSLFLYPTFLGHSLGAAGGIEAAACAKIFEHGIIPPTMNCDDPDVEAGCDLDYVPNKAYRYKSKEDIPKAILSDNLGFGKCYLLLTRRSRSDTSFLFGFPSSPPSAFI